MPCQFKCRVFCINFRPCCNGRFVFSFHFFFLSAGFTVLIVSFEQKCPLFAWNIFREYFKCHLFSFWLLFECDTKWKDILCIFCQGGKNDNNIFLSAAIEKYILFETSVRFVFDVKTLWRLARKILKCWHLFGGIIRIWREYPWKLKSSMKLTNII